MTSVENVEVERPYREEIETPRPQPRRPAVRASVAIGAGLLLLAGAAFLGRTSRGVGKRTIRRGASAAMGKLGKVKRGVEKRAVRERVPATIGNIAGDLGRGFVSGTFGTLAITTASSIDSLITESVRAKKEGRKPALKVSDAIVMPWAFSADVVSQIFGITPKDDAHKRSLSVLTHWEYGSSWGLTLPLIYATGLRGVPAMATVLAGQLTAEMVVMPSFKLFPGPTKWGKQAIISSIYQHAIYAAAAVFAYEQMRPRALSVR